MSQYSASKWLGHREDLYRIFEYIRKHDIPRVFFDPFQTEVDERDFASEMTDWKEFYGNIKEELPPGMPEPMGKNSHMACFVDAVHAGNVVTRRSHIGVLIDVINDYPVLKEAE